MHESLIQNPILANNSCILFGIRHPNSGMKTRGRSGGRYVRLWQLLRGGGLPFILHLYTVAELSLLKFEILVSLADPDDQIYLLFIGGRIRSKVNFNISKTFGHSLSMPR